MYFLTLTTFYARPVVGLWERLYNCEFRLFGMTSVECFCYWLTLVECTVGMLFSVGLNEGEHSLCRVHTHTISW